MFKTLLASHFAFSLASPIADTDTEIYVDKVSTFKPCGKDSDILILKSFQFSPNPIKKGVNSTVLASGTLSQDIEDPLYKLL